MTDTWTTGNNYLLDAFDMAATDAEAQGREVIRSTDTTLLLDFDNGSQQEQYGRMLERLQRALPGVQETVRWTSKSGRGVHVMLSLPKPLTVTERLLLQAVLGSDPTREMLGLMLLHSGVENPIMLFKPKGK